MSGNNIQQQIAGDKSDRIEKAPWIYRMCSVLEYSDAKGLISFLMVGGICAYGGHKMQVAVKNNQIKTAIVIAEKANDKNGYVTFADNGHNLASGKSDILLEPRLIKMSLAEAKQEIVSGVEQANSLTEYATPGSTGILGGLMGMAALGFLIEKGDEANDEWENKKRRKAAYKAG